MPVENDFLPFAAGAGANVLSQSDYAALAQLLTGFESGVASSQAFNKVWRQSSIMAAVLAQFIADETGNAVIDDGTTATILASLKAAFTGRLLSVNSYTVAGSAIFTPNSANSSILALAQGAGGGGAGATTTTVSQISVGAPGSSGAFGMGLYQLSSASPIALTIGAGGIAGQGSTGSNGGTGGTTSIGTLMSCPGGPGGTQSGAVSASSWIGGSGNVATAPTGANLFSSRGNSGGMTLVIGAQQFAALPGGAGLWGNNQFTNGGGASGANGILGSGGQGSCNGNGASNAFNGGAGGAGWAWILEFGSK